MKLFFDDDAVFADPASFDDLEAIFQAVRQGRHALVIVDIGAFLDSDFFGAGLSLRAQGQLREMTERLLYENLQLNRAVDPLAHARPETLHVEVRARPGEARGPCLWSLTPADAAAWVGRRLVVYIENDRDAALLLGAAAAYARRPILDAVHRSDPWLACEGKGGHGEVRRRIEEAGRLDRCFAIVDRDATDDPVRVGDHARLEATCAARTPEVPFHVWERRNIESYLPLPYLRRRAGRSTTLIGVLERLDAMTGDDLGREDMKRHLGKTWCRAALKGCRPAQDGSTPLDAHELDAHVGDELRRVLDRIEEYL